jgi:hypothetical protein
MQNENNFRQNHNIITLLSSKNFPACFLFYTVWRSSVFNGKKSTKPQPAYGTHIRYLLKKFQQVPHQMVA